MKVGISTSLATHMAQGTTTLCTCWKVTLQDSTVYGFTDHDAVLVFSGVTFEAKTGFAASNIDTQTRLAVDNLEAIGFLDSEVITAGDLTAGKWDFAEVEIFTVNWRDLAMGRDLLMRGRLGAVSQSQNTFTAELRGLTNAYSQTIGQLYQPACRATLGDARCQVELTPYSVTGTLDSVSSNQLVLFDAERTEAGPTGGKAITGITKSTLPTVSSTAHGFVAGQVVYIYCVQGMAQINGQHYIVKTVAINSFTLAGVDSTNFTTYTSGGTVVPQGNAGTFDYGKLTMTSGASTGLSTEVKAYAPGTITLQLQLPSGCAAGDTYTLVAGCGKRFLEDCVTRFNNGVNFRGEPHLPGVDKVMQFGGH